MLIKCFFLIIFLCPLVLTTAKAKSIFSPIAYIWQNDVVMQHTDCEKTQTCSLKKVRFLVRDYHFTIDNDDVFGTTLYAWYETDSLATLEDYVFVQLVHGCRYSSIVENGQEVFEFSYVQKIFDATRPANFKDWIIDSIDNDPVYNSTSGRSRHFLYRFTVPPYIYDARTEYLFGLRRPKAAVLHVTDFPSQGMYIAEYNRAVSTSFTYRMGIFRTKDVPLVTEAENIDFATPLIEFEWQNSWIYDHATGKFEKRTDISPVCAISVTT